MPRPGAVHQGRLDTFQGKLDVWEWMDVPPDAPDRIELNAYDAQGGHNRQVRLSVQQAARLISLLEQVQQVEGLAAALRPTDPDEEGGEDEVA